jgi:hypothetical protein
MTWALVMRRRCSSVGALDRGEIRACAPGAGNERFRALDGDFIVQMIPVTALRALARVKLYRAWGARPFSSAIA